MSKYQQRYKELLSTPEEFALQISSGDRIWCGAGPTTATEMCNAIADRYEELEDVTLVNMLTFHPLKVLTSSKYQGHINYHSLFFGGIEHKFAKESNIIVNSLHLSNVFDVLRDVYKVNTVMTQCSPMDDEGYFHLGVMATFVAGQLVDAGVPKRVFLQVNKHQCFTEGVHNKIHISQVTGLYEHNMPLAELPQPPVTDVDNKIASYIIPMVPDGACLQVGLGGLANAVAYGLKDKKNLSCQTEMFTDSMMELAKQGVMTGNMEASFALGSSDLYEFCGNNVKFAPINMTNNYERVGAQENFISINACLMVDLTGQVCSESIGHRQYSCTGGQLDFVRGARKSKGGKSFLCLPSTVTNKDGSVSSRINVNLPAGAVITTPRTDTMYVVTEYGVADLFGRSIPERVNEIIAIAHPDFRDELRTGAIEAGLIKE
ncbi:MAG: acetyl-CoA hydrolase/transferase family protein [Anaerotignum sp.]